MQRIAILGSTGSIGTNALRVVARFPDDFKVVALSTNSNIELVKEQTRRFKPEAVSIVDKEKARGFKGKARRYEGEDGLCKMVQDIRVDMLLVGIVGSSALLPILKAMPNIKRLALANKEALVMAGDIVMERARKKNVKILPIDSEHSAIFQCIMSNNTKEIKNIFLTGSGGPLLKVPKSRFKDITPKEAINHPKWKMGRKISVDSATMMNKGLEVIEAHHLFGLDADRIKVLIHPEIVVHSMVEFIDGSILAQMSTCDMRIPIQYALTYPERSSSPIKGITFNDLKTLHFYKPDFKKFPCLEMAYESSKKGGTYPCVLNASNEVAVGEFLKERIKFTGIPRVVEKVLGLHRGIYAPELKDILEIDEWARQKTKELLSAIHR